MRTSVGRQSGCATTTTTITATHVLTLSIKQVQTVAETLNRYTQWQTLNRYTQLLRHVADHFYVELFSTLEQTHCSLVTCDSK